MQLNVLLFASWAEALGASSVTLTLPTAATVADVLAAARMRIAESDAGGRALPRPMVAVNHKYAKAETPVCVGDEVAIIPPVAGG